MQNQDQSSNLNSSRKNESKKYMIKVVVLGDINVGKTNIIRRLLGQDFEELEATVGVEFGYLEAKDIDKNDKNVSLSIQLWDTSGAERYRSITTSHIRNADGAFLVYDINNEMSFAALDFWYDSIRKSSSDDIVIYLLGNKSDLALEDNTLRKVSKETAVEFVKRNNIYHWTECSAKNNINIKDTFKSFYKSKSLINKILIIYI
jgi:small GTP-binding protein